MVLAPLLVRQTFHWLFEPALSEILKPKNIEPWIVGVITKTDAKDAHKSTKSHINCLIRKLPMKEASLLSYRFRKQVAGIHLAKFSEIGYLTLTLKIFKRTKLKSIFLLSLNLKRCRFSPNTFPLKSRMAKLKFHVKHFERQICYISIFQQNSRIY